MKLDIASSYSTMKEMLHDADLQGEGKSSKVLWDPYLSGARVTTENHLKQHLGVEDLLLTNSGMTSIYIALVVALKRCKTIFMNSRMYFENEELIHTFKQFGAQIKTIDNASDVIEKKPHSLLFIEPTTNDATSNPLVESLESAEVLFSKFDSVIVDNSLFGPKVKWLTLNHRDLVICESGVKHLTEHTVFGVIYGRNLTEHRELMRQIGVGMPTRCIEEAKLLTFKYTFELRKPMKDIQDCISNKLSRLFVIKTTQLEGVYAPLIYFLPKKDIFNYKALEVITDQLSEKIGGGFIRAGFGWKNTTFRAYGENRLNQINGSNFIRFSIGTEEIEFFQKLFSSLLELAQCHSELPLEP